MLFSKTSFSTSRMEGIMPPVTPEKLRDQRDDTTSFQCVGKSMRFQSKSQLATPNVRTWLRSPILNSKRKSISPRPPEPNPSKEKPKSVKKDVENSTLPAIVAKEKTKTNPLKISKKSRKETLKNDKLASKKRHSFPSIEMKQQSEFESLPSELQTIITGKVFFNNAKLTSTDLISCSM